MKDLRASTATSFTGFMKLSSVALSVNSLTKFAGADQYYPEAYRLRERPNTTVVRQWKQAARFLHGGAYRVSSAMRRHPSTQFHDRGYLPTVPAVSFPVPRVRY